MTCRHGVPAGTACLECARRGDAAIDPERRLRRLGRVRVSYEALAQVLGLRSAILEVYQTPEDRAGHAFCVLFEGPDGALSAEGAPIPFVELRR